MATEKLSVILELVTAQYKREMQSADDSTRKFADSAKKAGQTLTLGLTLPIAAVGVTAVNSLRRIETIGAQTNAALRSTGGAAKVTREEIDDLADSLEKLTSVEAESITEGQNLLLTFTRIRNEVGEGNDIFDRATRAMVDMSVAMGTDASGSAIQLGKALNDPIAGLSALTRVGIQFTEDQKRMIEGFVAAGDVMSAQKVILAELETQFGGSAEALGTTLTGKIDKAKHAFGTMTETLLTGLLPVIEDAAGFVENLSEKFENLSEDQQKWTGIALLGVAAAGPLAIALGAVARGYLAIAAALKAVSTASAIRGVQVLARGGIGTPPIVPLGGAAAAGGAVSVFSRLAGVLGLVTGAAWLTAEGLQAVLGVETELEAQTQIQERAWSTRDAQVRNYEAGLKNVAKNENDLNDTTKGLVETHDSWMTGMANVQAGLGEVATVSSEARLAALELGEANRAAAKSFRDDLTEAIAGFVTFFDGAVDEIDLSLKELEAQFEARRTQNERFWNGLAVLAAAGLDDLVAELQLKGPEAAGVVEDLVANMDRAFAWEQRIEESRRQAASMANAIANGLAGETDTVGAAFLAFGISLARAVEAGFSTADLSNTLTQLMDLADQFNGGGTTTPSTGGSQFQKFASGGVVKGPWGSPQLVIAHAGETILPTHLRNGSTTINRGGATINVASPSNNLPQDLQYGALLANHATFGKF